MIIGCSTGLFACHPETLAVEQSLTGGYVSGGFVDAFENQPTIDGDIWLPKGDVIHHIDTVAMTPIGSWDVASLHGLSLDAAVHDPLTEALWTSDGSVWKLWFERNLLLVGQEIVQFASAVQIGSLTWRLSKLLRGRYGTEWAMPTHQPGESALLLGPATLTRVSDLDEVGIERLYRTVSIGSDPSLPDAIAFINEATSLKPYAPVHIQGSRNGAGDLTVTWFRRTRYGGAWRDLVDVPLNEATEAYEVDVLDLDGSVLRTLSSSSPTIIYTAADQTSDFGVPQSSIAIAVHQLSAAVGRGFAGRATLWIGDMDNAEFLDTLDLDVGDLDGLTLGHDLLDAVIHKNPSDAV
ncbi:MAG: hypothetical protein OEU92_29910, partial [Alphaproteobacteria bacterium]|nr:hypothetical protein [Alphaproteobacteria bacterium]